jgi:hypothetical protein
MACGREQVRGRSSAGLGALRRSGIAGHVTGSLCSAGEKNRGGKREKRREKREGRAGLKSYFLKILHRNMKKFEYKSCTEFENLQLLF